MSAVHRARRAPLRVVLAALVAAGLAALTVAPAHAAAFRFWGFYQLTNGAWAFAQKGSDQTVPKDGSVDGWRFAVADEASTRFPRAVLTFDQICATTPAETGKKRVGVVVDFGRAADSSDNATPPEPRALCAVVATDATSSVVLAAAGEVRTEKGLVCGVAGFPATECGAPVKTVTPEAKAADQPVTIAAPAATPSAAASTPASAGTGSDVAGAPAAASSGTNTTAYVIAVIVLLALIGYLVVRSRSRARRDA
ncbi:SCO2322 family protein [Terrabacter sp. 2RAF25]|uniref:SCO2322 family protein n=1 Tax=Terrabacter sp. 2RAF25 TaxID=3232998 RepID=UPI003F9B34E9